MKNKLYNYLKNNNVDIEKDVFDYGFALFYSYSIYILFIIPISIFNDSIIEVFLFILLYIPISKNIGGLHLKNQYHCIILSIIVTLLTPYIRKYIPVNYYFATFIIVLNFLLYNRFVPVDCKEKQLSDDEKKSYRIFSLKIHLIYSFFILFFCSLDMRLLFQITCFIELVSNFSICLSVLKQAYFQQI